ncbi:unnamed protein product [Arctogadus glacialis]
MLLKQQNKSQEELLTLLASEYDEWLDLYPCLSLLASIALIVPVSSVNCERDSSAMNRMIQRLFILLLQRFVSSRSQCDTRHRILLTDQETRRYTRTETHTSP